MSTAFQTPATGGGEENSACQKASKKSTSVLVTVLMQLDVKHCDVISGQLVLQQRIHGE